VGRTVVLLHWEGGHDNACLLLASIEGFALGWRSPYAAAPDHSLTAGRRTAMRRAMVPLSMVS
jgi:hypothetical protein